MTTIPDQTQQTLEAIEKIAAYSKEFLKWTKGRKFRNPRTRRDVLFVSLPPEEKEAVHRKWEAMEQHGGEEGYSKKLRKDLVDWHRSDLEPSADGKMRVKKKPPQALIDEGLVVRDVATDRGRRQHVTWSLTSEGSKVWYEERGRGKKGKTASYPEDFLRRVEHMEFHNPTTGNKVKFVSLPQEEQAKWYAKYQAAMAKREQQSKKPKRPTFGKAREATFGALEEAGWSLKKGLKVPKAERDIDGDRVILHFKPQAVWMEVKGKTPPRSLHTDIRDVDPKEWVSTLEKEAKDAIALEESFKAASTEDLLSRLERTAGYSPDFMRAVETRTFRNPDTDNKVKFVSLPPAEQQKIYQQWVQRQQGVQKPETKEKEVPEGGALWDHLMRSDYEAKREREVEEDLHRRDLNDLRRKDPKWHEKPFDEQLPFLREIGHLNGQSEEFESGLKGEFPKRWRAVAQREGVADASGADFKDAAQKVIKALESVAEGMLHHDEYHGGVGGGVHGRPLAEKLRSQIEAFRGAVERQVPKSWEEGIDKWYSGSPKVEQEVPGLRRKWQKSLKPADERKLIHREWSEEDKRKSFDEWAGSPEGQRAQKKIEEETERRRALLQKEKEDYAERQRAFQQRQKKGFSFDAGPRWHDLGPEQREAMRHAFGEMFQGPLVQAVPVSGQHPGAEEPPPEPPPPAEVKRMLADRMRGLARSLMVAGTRQPRQQMIEIWKAFDTLLDQLDLLADQPGRLALRRRILMGLRQRLAGGM